MLKIIFCLLIAASKLSFASDAIFLIRGNIIDFHSSIHHQAEAIIEDFVARDYPDAYFANLHNSDWEVICSTLQDLHQTQKLERIVLIGHSWGVQAAWDIARCVYQSHKRSIDLVVALDAVQKPFAFDIKIVPWNVKQVFAVSQPHGGWWQSGVSDFKRENGSKAGISFMNYQLNWHPLAHDLLLLKLAQNGMLQTQIRSILKHH